MEPRNKGRRNLGLQKDLQKYYLKVINEHDYPLNSNVLYVFQDPTSLVEEGINSNSTFHRADIEKDMYYFLNQFVPAVAYEMFPTRAGSAREFQSLIEYYMKKAQNPKKDPKKLAFQAPHFSNVTRMDLIESKLMRFEGHCVGCFPQNPSKSFIPCKFTRNI